MSKVVVSLFDKSGVMVQPWLEAGYECWIVDIEHPSDTTQDNLGVWRLGWDLHTHPPVKLMVEWERKGVAFISAFPPCTHLSVSGARWFKGKGLRKLAESVDLFATAAEFCETYDAPYMIENPVSTISTYWRKPDYTFHPHEYSWWCPDDWYTKKTCLWTGNGFVMPPTRSITSDTEPDNRIHSMFFTAKAEDRGELRSVTPLGFARAVYETNNERKDDGHNTIG
tara:strand:+ start:2075 stop:2749 length:675 start_codon:yes stop_codon:yes gene_type:complete